MQEYLRKGRFSAFMNDLGLRAVIALLAQIWFILLWGLTVPSVVAGLALGLLGQMALSRWRKENAVNREQALRRRLGGEAVLEDMLLKPVKENHLQAATLLAGKYEGLEIREAGDEGVLCRCGDKTLLVVCPVRPAECEFTAGEAAALERTASSCGADRIVVCLTCGCAGSAAAWAETAPIPIRFISRATMLSLAGRAAPVTDEQLVALGARKKRSVPGGIAQSMLMPEKAKRYMTYGVGLMLLYVVTGLKYYPVPGGICLLLGVLCRCIRQTPERL